MSGSNPYNSQLSLTPLGAGDLIDRSVRFYRKNFWTFILIASPPIVTGAVFLIGWMMLARNLFSVNPANPYDTSLYPVFLSLGNMLIWLIQLIAIFVVMGGASRNFVRHILFDEPITVRETYRNVKSRLAGLTVASSLLGFSLGLFGLILFYIGLIIIVLLVAGVFWVFSFSPVLTFIVSLTVGLGTFLALLWLFFLIVSRFVYVPQVMLVEGQGAFSAIGRSVTLAGKNVKRVAALFIFTLVAIYSALSLLYVPLIWYAIVNGIDLFGLEAADTLPAWFEISKQVVLEISLILLTPILMTGLCLLYVDERVHSEGYDIELMAARRLGEIPNVPEKYINPLQPALSGQKTTPPINVLPEETYRPVAEPVTKPEVKNNTGSILGLD